MLNHEGKFQVGQRIRAHDFNPVLGFNIYAEGVIIEAPAYMNGVRGYLIQCDGDVYQGHEVERQSRVGQQVLAPFTGVMGDSEDRIQAVD